MEALKGLRSFSLIYCLLVICSIILVSIAFAGSEDLIVTEVTRITPSVYRASNIFYGERDWGAWNRDNTRMLIYESPADTHPIAGKTGRGLVWGFISDFKSWTDIADYESKIKPLPASINNTASWNTGQRTDPTSVWWSIFPGEDNILYITREDGWLVKLNVDTDVITNVISFDPGGGVDIKNAKIYGWTKDNTLIISFGYDDWANGGYEINVQTPSKTFISASARPSMSNWCTAEYRRWPDFWAHGHGSKSPSGNKFVERCYSTSGSKLCVTNLQTCNTEYQTTNNSIDNTHFSWKASENWWISNTGGKGSDFSAPTLYDYHINQTIFDDVTGTVLHHPLLTQQTAHAWTSASGTRTDNYNAHFIATLRKDGKQIIFTSTNGKYSKEDCARNSSVACPNGWASDTWGYEGLFLVDLAYASGSQTCTSFTYTAWGECQPNNTQTRTVTSSSPSGCTGGNPVLTQSCTYTPGASTYNILKTNGTPTIDGNLGEYALANPLTFSSSSGGNTVTVRTLWSSEALYLGINVTDTQLNASVTTTDGSVWSDDSVEWFIDTYNDGGGSTNPSSSFMLPDDYHGIVNILNAKYDSQGTTSSTPTGSWNGTWQSAVKLNGTNNNNTDNDTGYTIEIKIPWTSIGYSSAPSQDALIGMSFALNDKDAAGTNSIMMSDITSGFENASNWQSVLLSGTAAFVDATPPAPPMALMIQ